VSGRARGRAWVHAVAFALLLASAYAQYRGNLHSSLRLVWASIGLSGLAIVVSVANLLVPGPRRSSPSPAASE
jgi:hypothetical protein